jgi:hypothetical protein
MVYCSKCGAENPDDASNCSKCGASFKATASHGYSGYRFEDRWMRRGHIWGVVFGLFIMMLGVSSLIGWDIWDIMWPMFLILVGLIIVANSFMRGR